MFMLSTLMLPMLAFFWMVAIAATAWDGPAPTAMRVAIVGAAVLTALCWWAWRERQTRGWVVTSALFAGAFGLLAGPTAPETLGFWGLTAAAIGWGIVADRRLHQPLDWESMRDRLDALPPGERDFSADGRALLWRVVRTVAPDAGTCVEYQLLGFEDLADQAQSAAMLRAMAEGDWTGVRTHQAIAGLNDMAVAVVLRLMPPGGATVHHWVLLKSPFEPFEGESVITHDAVAVAPEGGWQPLGA